MRPNFSAASRSGTRPGDGAVAWGAVAWLFVASVTRVSGVWGCAERFVPGHERLRGWPIATVAFYGPNLSQATKAAIGIVPSENAEVEELRDWKVDRGDIRSDPDIAREMLKFIEEHQVRSVAMTDGIIGCPHQEGIDYEGEWCPVCEFWHGRDRFTGQRVH